MVTVKGNNFGDQIMELRQYTIETRNQVTISGYKSICVESNPEGEHLPDNKIKRWARAIINKKGMNV